MKIAVIGSNGRVARLVISEALNRGYEVTGFGMGENLSKTSNYIEKNGLDLTFEDLKGFDVVVDAVGGWTKETIPNITNVMKHLASILDGSEVRLVCVGGAGGLFVNKEQTITVDMGKDFPDDWKPLSNAHKAGLEYLMSSENLNWLSISPACNFVADGDRLGSYQIGGDNLIVNSKGESEISYADYALALVDELVNKRYNKQRISLCSK